MANHRLPCALLVGLISSIPVNTFAMGERITLMLSGAACGESHEAIDLALRQTTGVRHADLQAVPGHILVDIEDGAVTPESLAEQLNTILAARPPCRAEVMKSCISAAPRAAGTAIP